MTHINRVANYSRPRAPNASHPEAREPDAHHSGEDDTSDLVTKALDHEGIWARYNAKAGGVQRVVPAKDGDE